MKKISATFIIVVLLWPAFAGANPEEVRLPVFENIKFSNEEKRLLLIQNYSENEFLACYSCSQNEDINPFAVAKCLREADYCLLEQNVPSPSCSGGNTVSGGTCVSAELGCKERYGMQSYFTGSILGGSYTCECQAGFGWNNDQSQCIQTACPEAMIYYSQYKTDNGSFLHGRCMSHNNACQSEFGEFSQFKRFDTVSNVYCSCQDGYEFNEAGTECVEKVIVAGITGPGEEELIYIETIEREVEATSALNLNLATRLKGRILLQAEEQGEAWYVNPTDNMRYFLATPIKALEVMRKFGLGATHEFITSYDVYPAYVAGKILIDVDDLGKAYYIHPVTRQAHYLGSPELALEVMREVGLGISNSDIRQIEVGEL